MIAHSIAPFLGGSRPMLLPPGAPDVWLDADNINLNWNRGMVDGAVNTTWKNRGSFGTGCTPTQSVAGAKALFRKIAEAGKMRNLSALETTSNGQGYVSSAFALKAQPIVWGMAMRSTTSGTQVYAAGAGAQQVTGVGTSDVQIYAGTSAGTGKPSVANAWQSLAWRFDSGSSFYSLNGSSSIALNPNVQGLTSLSVFSNPPLSASMVGMIASLLIYWTAPVTLTEIHTYHTAKYGAFPQ